MPSEIPKGNDDILDKN